MGRPEIAIKPKLEVRNIRSIFRPISLFLAWRPSLGELGEVLERDGLAAAARQDQPGHVRILAAVAPKSDGSFEFISINKDSVFNVYQK